MQENDSTAEKLSDKEEVNVGAGENGTPATSSEGEYSEDKKLVLGALKEHYGEDIDPSSEQYPSRLENYVASDLLPKAGKLKKYDEANTRLIAMMESEPELSGILSDMGKGAKFHQALRRNIDVTSLPEEDEEGEDAWLENAKSREQRYRETEQRRAELASNEEKSLQTLEEFVAEKKLEGEDVTKFAKLVADFLDRAYSGDISADFLEAMFWYMNRDKELATQREIGERKGRNEKIALGKFDAKDYEGDSLPAITSSGGAAPEKQDAPEQDPFLANLNAHLDQGSILNR